MTPGAVHRSPGICLTAEENPGKTWLGERLIKAMRPVIVSNGVPYLQITSVGRLVKHASFHMRNILLCLFRHISMFVFNYALMNVQPHYSRSEIQRHSCKRFFIWQNIFYMHSYEKYLILPMYACVYVCIRTCNAHVCMYVFIAPCIYDSGSETQRPFNKNLFIQLDLVTFISHQKQSE